MTEPDLPPSLERLGRDLDAAFDRHERVRARVRRRRAVIALAVIATGAPAAVATRPLWDPNTEAGMPIEGLILADGASGGENWQLSSYRSGQRLCLRFTVRVVGIAPVSSCFARWSGTGVQHVTAVSRDYAYVFGRVGTETASVTVATGNRRTTAQAIDTRVRTELTQQDGRAFRVFVAAFEQPLNAGARLTVETTPDG